MAQTAEEKRARSRAYYQAHRERIIARVSAYRETNSEKAKACQAAHYAKNRDRVRARVAAWQAAHAEEIKAKQAVYRAKLSDEQRKSLAESRARYHAANLEACTERSARWATAHPESRQARNRTRRALRAGAKILDLTRAQWEAIKQLYANRCVYCGQMPKRLTQDHIIPLSKGGNHTVTNIVPACKPCNSRKWVNPPSVPVQPALLV